MSSHSARGSPLANFMRTEECDDVLLCVTAAIGIFMPGCVYMFYQYAHKLYTGYVEVIFIFLKRTGGKLSVCF